VRGSEWSVVVPENPLAPAAMVDDALLCLRETKTIAVIGGYGPGR
jgi:hypothetical protein